LIIFITQLAINESTGLRVAAHLAAEKDEYVYRSFVALGEYRVLFSEILDTPKTPLGEQSRLQHTIQNFAETNWLIGFNSYSSPRSKAVSNSDEGSIRQGNSHVAITGVA
jgi:Coatomer epsilon subunit